MNVPEKLAAIIRWVMRDVTYHRHYLCTVQAQLGSTVDLLPESDDIKGTGLQGVPIDTIPGVDATVPPGAQMTLYFDSGDPAKPRAVWVSGSPIELKLAGGSMPVARVGDQITITSATAGPYPVAGVGIITGGAPLVKA